MDNTKRAQLRKEKPDTWIAVKEGDELTGTVLDVDVAYSDVQAQGGRSDGWYPLLTIKVEKGDGYEAGQVIKVHGFGTVLHNEILRRQPAPGESISLTYLGTGEVKTKGQNPPELYRLTVAGRDPREAAAHAYGQLQPKGPIPPRPGAITQPPTNGNGTQLDAGAAGPVSSEPIQQGELNEAGEPIPF